MPAQYLSPHFSLREMTYSQLAERLKIPNVPPLEVVTNLTALCKNILEPLRLSVGPLHISSGYRGPVLNRRVGGASKSQHVLGQAADCECFSIGTRTLALRVLKLKLPFDQLILEYASTDDPQAGWVHLSYVRNGKNRGQVLRAVRDPKTRRTKYLSGLT